MKRRSRKRRSRKSKSRSTSNLPVLLRRTAKVVTVLAILLISAMLFVVSPSNPKPYIPPLLNQTTISQIETLQRAEEVLAFPGALGFAKHSVGGRSGRVIVVNTVDDVVDSSDSLTSLREAIEEDCLLYTSPSPRDRQKSRMPSSA